MTTYLSRRSAVGLLRICLSQARNAAEEARIVDALVTLGVPPRDLPCPEGREDLLEALIRALRGLPADERELVLLRVEEAESRSQTQQSADAHATPCIYCGSDELRYDPASDLVDCAGCGRLNAK